MLLVSNVQQNESVTHICIFTCFFFLRFFLHVYHYTALISLCYTEVLISYLLYIYAYTYIYVLVFICQSQPLNLSLHLLTL